MFIHFTFSPMAQPQIHPTAGTNAAFSGKFNGFVQRYSQVLPGLLAHRYRQYCGG
ncbi:MAG: hypothetical protein WA902_03655 [Thermosynechococcaceae cyanobacterium]